jgi:tetratricopeptide (TPR) repeat protein
MTVISWKPLLKTLVILAAVVGIYWPAIHGDWLWDDSIDISGSVVTRSPTGLWSIWFEPGSQPDYYPIKSSVQWVQWRLLGMDTLGYHLTNIILHAIGAVLVWRLLARFNLRLAWLGGLLFAVHPANVESVAWIAELKNTLSLLPFLGAMIAWIDYENKGTKRDYALALGLFLVAMLCKTTMVMFPVVILLYAWWKRGRSGIRDLKLSAPFFAISIVLGILTMVLQTAPGLGPHEIHLGGFFSRLALAGSALSFYFCEWLWPFGLAPLYPPWTIDPPMLIEGFLLLVWGGALYALWHRHTDWSRHVLLGLGFFILILFPILGFTPAAYMESTWVMDHFLYLPMIGLIGLVLAALGQIRLQAVPGIYLGGLGILGGAMAVFAWESHAYAGEFINEETLWTYALQSYPDAFLAHNNLGAALTEEGRIPEAIAQYEKAVRLCPGKSDLYYGLGCALAAAGRFADAAAEFQQAVEINPNSPYAHLNLGVASMRLGKPNDAITEFETVLRIYPNNADAHGNLGLVLTQMGQLPRGLEELEIAVKLNPGNIGNRFNFANALAQSNRLPEAMEQYETILRVNPAHADARNNLASILQQLGRLPEAIDEYNQALEIAPNDPSVHYNLGCALMQAGRAAEAAQQYEQALQLNPNLVDAHNNLGTALAQMGQLPEAIEQVKAALRLDPKQTASQNNLTRLQALQKSGKH